MDKQAVVYLYNGGCSAEKRTTDTCYNVDKSQDNYAVWEKPDQREYIA